MTAHTSTQLSGRVLAHFCGHLMPTLIIMRTLARYQPAHINLIGCDKLWLLSSKGTDDPNAKCHANMTLSSGQGGKRRMCEKFDLRWLHTDTQTAYCHLMH